MADENKGDVVDFGQYAAGMAPDMSASSPAQVAFMALT
jgi:hypothetical protein